MKKKYKKVKINFPDMVSCINLAISKNNNKTQTNTMNKLQLLNTMDSKISTYKRMLSAVEENTSAYEIIFQTIQRLENEYSSALEYVKNSTALYEAQYNENIKKLKLFGEMLEHKKGDEVALITSIFNLSSENEELTQLRELSLSLNCTPA